jgi:hypothetical protein
MDEMVWHRRETRRQTEKTNLILQPGESPAYSNPGTRVVYILPEVATYTDWTDANGFYFLRVQEGTYEVSIRFCGDACDYHWDIEVYSDCTHNFTSYPTECP